jgi:hypothetical protein
MIRVPFSFKFFLILLFTCFAGKEALSQCSTVYPFSFNCPLPAAGLNAALTPVHVPDNATLKLASVLNYQGAVIRDGFYTAGDSPEVLFTGLSGNCAANSLVNDNGSCVDVTVSGGGSWKASSSENSADLRQWGVKFDDSTDNSTALQSALNWMVTGHVLRCPDQTLPARFGTALASTFTSQTASASLFGPGSDLCVLKYTGTSTAITVTHNSTNGKRNSTHWRDFTLCTTQTGSGTGIKLVETAFAAGQIAMNDFTTVVFRGCDGWGVTNYWAQAIDVQGVSIIDFRGISIIGGSAVLGNGVSLSGNAGIGLYGFQYNFSGVNINNQLTPISIGELIQGVTITGGSNLTNVGTGVNVTSGNGTDQLVVANSQFNCISVCISSQMGDVFIHDNYFILSANNAIAINTAATNGLHISHNVYRNGGAFTGLVGEIIGLGIPGVYNIIDHNTYWSLAYARAYTVAGNYPDQVDGNVYYSLTNAFPLLFSGVTALTDQSLPFASASPCTAALLDRKQRFNNSNTAVWGATVAGGGANDVWARCNTNWNVMGK